MEISFHSHLHSNTVIATKFCTWHDSCPVVACAKLCCNLMASNGITARQRFHWIWIADKKSFVKRAPGLVMLYGVINVCFISSGGRFKNTYELLNLRALKISKLHKNHIFQCMGKIFCVEFQRVPLKFHTKYLTHTLKDVDFIHIWKFKSSLI